jgi:predicted metalloenzyme YecM
MHQSEFYSSAQTFLKDLFQDMGHAHIELATHWDIDHLCYRAETEGRYAELKDEFAAFATLLIESEVNGRMIATYKLREPIFHEDWRIDLVELPAPKKGKVTKEGFEHIEIVCDVPFSTLQEKFKQLSMDTKGLGKDYNQELEICLGERNIKFHLSSLESVIELEKNEKVWDAIKESHILSAYKDYSPLIAGTFPLGIATTLSDVDVLMKTSDITELKNSLTLKYGNRENFEVREETFDGLATLLCQFSFNSIPFEIFAQNQEPVLQTAYRHFQVEERLLKYGGDGFRTRLLGEKSLGLKTEIAIAKLLNLPDEPYSGILKMSHKSGSELEKICGLYRV